MSFMSIMSWQRRAACQQRIAASVVGGRPDHVLLQGIETTVPRWPGDPFVHVRAIVEKCVLLQHNSMGMQSSVKLLLWNNQPSKPVFATGPSKPSMVGGKLLRWFKHCEASSLGQLWFFCYPLRWCKLVVVTASPPSSWGWKHRQHSEGSNIQVAQTPPKRTCRGSRGYGSVQPRASG